MQYAKVVCVDGPLHGRSLSLELNTGNHTLPFVLHGQAGQYRAGRWVPDPQAERRKAESLGYPTTVEPDADIPL